MASTSDFTDIVLTVPTQTARDIEAAAAKVKLSAAVWVLTLIEGPLRNFRQCREQDSKPKRRRPREND